MVLSGMTSCIACDSNIFSASVVESAISLWSLDVQRMGQAANIMGYPVLECTLDASDVFAIVQVPAKSAST